MSIVGGAPAMLDSSARSRVTVNDTLRRVLGEIEKPDGRSTLVDYSDLGAKHRAEARAIMEAAPLKIRVRRTPAAAAAAPMAEVPRLAFAEEAAPERAAGGAGGSVAPEMPKIPAKKAVSEKPEPSKFVDYPEGWHMGRNSTPYGKPYGTEPETLPRTKVVSEEMAKKIMKKLFRYTSPNDDAMVVVDTFHTWDGKPRAPMRKDDFALLKEIYGIPKKESITVFILQQPFGLNYYYFNPATRTITIASESRM